MNTYIENISEEDYILISSGSAYLLLIKEGELTPGIRKSPSTILLNFLELA